ncbi:hypothetical protein OIU74_010280 [Salix koriyanagi]|uniref:Uncharacterized protein n=1 Tax=Salix koriyanagi TaxID=2511006 RepID=A0A9Q0TC83_9ROSI|nr:hypothetical protein OIU74_010280 [Salix koriyanagi]
MGLRIRAVNSKMAVYPSRSLILLSSKSPIYEGKPPVSKKHSPLQHIMNSTHGIKISLINRSIQAAIVRQRGVRKTIKSKLQYAIYKTGITSKSYMGYNLYLF